MPPARPRRPGPSDVRSFAEDGFVAPVSLLSVAQCELIRDRFRSADKPAPIDWFKGHAASDDLVYAIATRPALLAWLTSLIGNDVVLWGADIVMRRPGTVHPWHCDMESAGADGFVSVWIGLENTTRESGLTLLSRSHRFGRSIQDVQHEHGFLRGQATDDDVHELGLRFDQACSLVQPDVGDGDAIIFDGRLWHASINRTQRKREALLLQYARADRPVFQPDLSRLEWPFLWKEERPPLVAVSGSADATKNRIVDSPLRHSKKLPNFFRSLSMPLGGNLDTGWRPHHLFDGATFCLDHLACHVSVLAPAHCPHPPHEHVEEEILVVLDGEADIILARAVDDPSPRRERFRAGDLVYHPAFRYHTIENPADRPVTYLMLKWRGAPWEAPKTVGRQVIRTQDRSALPGERLFKPQLLFEGPSNFLGKLHLHLTDLAPGGGYEPHADAYDVALLLLQGNVETCGQKLAAPAIAFLARDTLHGMSNTGTEPARYIVVELHAPALDAAQAEEDRAPQAAPEHRGAAPGAFGVRPSPLRVLQQLARKLRLVRRD